MQDQAGTVIGGSQLASGPHEPASISRRRLGRSAAKRSNTKAGAAQSKPIIAKRFIAKSLSGAPPPRNSASDAHGGGVGRRQMKERDFTPPNHGQLCAGR